MLTAIFALTLLVEIMMYLPLLWRTRRWIAGALVIGTSFVSGLYIAESPHVVSALLFLMSAARVFNLLRIVEARMHERYLLRVTRRTSCYFVIVQAVLLALAYYYPDCLDGPLQTYVWLLAVTQAAAGLIIVASTLRTLRRSRYQGGTHFLTDRELPTLSVLIPARNETTDLEDCLTSLLANNYPKLEIIVLDDCSQLKTSAIIKSFAHNGVRFVHGDEPSDVWLAKNQAYEKLAREATGELVLFCGVDVRFGTDTLRALVTSLVTREKKMISIMPTRVDGNVSSALIQPIRYWWELSLPRRLFNRPPVLSTAWLIRRESLQKLGGFGAVRRNVIPEAYFARELAKADGYSFMRSSDELQIRTAKSFHEQHATAIRVRYPQIHRRPELALLLALLEVTILLLPLVVLVVSLALGLWLPAILSLLSYGLLTITHVLIVVASNPQNTWIALFNLPIAVLVELVNGLESMIRYEFSTVDWKGRNVCVPVMHVVPHLPKID